MPDKVMGLMRNMRRHSSGERGNVVTMMMVGIGMAATLSLATYQLLSGPVATVSRVTQNNMATAQMLGVGQMVAMDAVNQTPSGDCDADGYVEPRDWVTTLSGLTGGGVLPSAIGVPTQDAWKTTLGYCVWDIGATFEGAGCGGAPANRLNGIDNPSTGTPTTQTSFAIISAGPNRRFETTCRNWNNADDVIVRGGDDIVKRYTYQEAATATSAIWALRADDPDSSRIERKAEVGAKIKMDNSQGLLQTALIQTTGKAIADGGLELGVASGVTCGPAGANEGLLRTKPTLTADLVAHYKMDETSGTAVADARGAFAGTWTGTPATIASTTGQIDTGFQFAGTAQFNVTDPGVSDLDFALGDSIGISAWVWIDSTSAGSDYIVRKSSTNSNFQLSKAGTSSIHFRYYSAPLTYHQFGSVTLPTNQWAHVVLTYTYGDPATAKIYVNGVACGACSWTTGTGTPAPMQDNNPLNIGVTMDGKLDEFRLYDRLLSADDVAALYAYTGGGGGGVPTSGLVTHLKLDETTGTAVVDAKGGTNSLLVTTGGDTWATQTTTGKDGTALNNDDTTGSWNYINVNPAAVDGLFATGGTISFWVSLVYNANNQFLFDSYGTSYSMALDVGNANGRIIFGHDFSGTNGRWEPTAQLPNNGWTHITVTYNASNAANVPKIYYNGVLQTLNTNQAPVGTALTGPTGPDFALAQGKYDDLRFYSRVLSDAEVTSLYEGTGGGTPSYPAELIGYWNLDETTGTTVDDAVGTSNGVLTGTTWPTVTTAGKSGGGYFRGGTGSMNVTPSSTAVSNLYRDGDMGAVSFWFKTSDPDFGNSIYITAGNGVNGWSIYRTGQMFYYTDAGGFGCETDPISLTAGVWHHVVAHKTQFYINGALQPTTCTFGAETNADTTPMLFGNTGVSPPEDALDDIRFYNRPLTGPEVAAIYAGAAAEYSSGGGGSTEEDLIVQYCDGATWQDVGGSAAGSGGIKASVPPGACDGTAVGEVRYISGFIYFCDGKEWRTF